jgi:hypothetical protein
MSKDIVVIDENTDAISVEKEVVIIDKETGFNKGLPKWPQLIIVGQRVSQEQAKDIVFRTDSFLVDPCEYSGGNNRDFNEFYRKKANLESLNEIHTHNGRSWNMPHYGKVDHFREVLGFIPLQYVYNNWASSCFVGGPAGFCSPAGDIFFCHNVGKYPSVEDVFNDFEAIAKAFPFLDMKAALYDGEECEDDTKFVVGFIIKNGQVSLTSTDMDLQNHTVDSDLDAIIDARMADLSGMSELGLPTDWYEEFAERVKLAVEQTHREFVEKVEQENEE